MKSDELRIYEDDISLADYYFGGESGEMVIFRTLDTLDWVKESEAYSFNNVKFAEIYVNAVTDCAVQKLMAKSKTYKLADIVSPVLDGIVSSVSQRTSKGEPLDQSRGYVPMIPITQLSKNYSANTFSGWPKISEFNIKLGLEKLEEYVGCWERKEEWMCCVEFLGFESEESSSYFVYEVEFSIPTPTYPIPQATASVYFSLEVSKMVPHAHDRSIDVSYVFESSNVIHFPGKADFQDNWIRDIIGCKLRFFRSLTF